VTVLLQIFVCLKYVMKSDVESMTSENDFVAVVLRMTVVLSDLQHFDMKLADSEAQIDV